MHLDDRLRSLKELIDEKSDMATHLDRDINSGNQMGVYLEMRSMSSCNRDTPDQFEDMAERETASRRKIDRTVSTMNKMVQTKEVPHAHAMHTPCTRYAHAMHTLDAHAILYAHATHMLCTCLGQEPRRAQGAARARRQQAQGVLGPRVLPGADDQRVAGRGGVGRRHLQHRARAARSAHQAHPRCLVDRTYATKPL